MDKSKTAVLVDRRPVGPGFEELYTIQTELMDFSIFVHVKDATIKNASNWTGTVVVSVEDQSAAAYFDRVFAHALISTQISGSDAWRMDKDSLSLTMPLAGYCFQTLDGPSAEEVDKIIANTPMKS